MHLPSMIAFVIYVIIRLVGIGIKDSTNYGLIGKITMNNDGLTFVYAIIILTTIIICMLFDIHDTIVWFVLKNRFVVRDTETLNNMKDEGLLPKDTQNVQLLMEKGQLQYDAELYDEWGLLKQK